MAEAGCPPSRASSPTPRSRPSPNTSPRRQAAPPPRRSTSGCARRPTRQVRALALTMGLYAVLLAGCGSERGAEPPAQPAAVGPDALARAVTPRSLKAHLAALEDVARQN